MEDWSSLATCLEPWCGKSLEECGTWLGLPGTVECDCQKHCTLQIGPSSVIAIPIIEPVKDRPGNLVASYLQEEP